MDKYETKHYTPHTICPSASKTNWNNKQHQMRSKVVGEETVEFANGRIAVDRREKEKEIIETKKANRQKQMSIERTITK